MSAGSVFHSNLSLLGYGKDASASRVPLSDEMFDHSNESAFQSVCYFLVHKLDPERCRMAFRHCWPVLDKKQAADFRHAVVAWLKEIKQSDPDAAQFPVINPALFLSPGGRKFKLLLLAISQYVLLKSIHALEHEHPSDELLLSRGDPGTQCGVLQASCTLSKQRFEELQKQRLISHTHYQRFADEFASTYRRLRTSAASLTQELGRLVAESQLPPELTHRLLQQDAQLVVPAVYEASGQHLAALSTSLEKVQRFCAEVQYSYAVVDSIVSGHVAKSVVDARELAVPPPVATALQKPGVLQEQRMDLVAFFDMFSTKLDHLLTFLDHCNLSQLKGLHGTLPSLVSEARRAAEETGHLLSELHTETEATRRRVQQLLAEAGPPPPQPAATAGRRTPPPQPAAQLLAPRTPVWRLEPSAQAPGQHPLQHLYNGDAHGADGSELGQEAGSASGSVAAGPRGDSDLTTVTSTRSPWTSAASSTVAARDNETQLRVGDSLSPCAPTSPSSYTAAAARLRELETLAVPRAGGGSQPADSSVAETSRSSFSSLFSPLASHRWRASDDTGAELSAVEALVGEHTAPADADGDVFPASVEAKEEQAVAGTGDSCCSAPVVVGGSPSAEVLQLRERTSVLLRSLRSPATSATTPEKSNARWRDGPAVSPLQAASNATSPTLKPTANIPAEAPERSVPIQLPQRSEHATAITGAAIWEAWMQQTASGGSDQTPAAVPTGRPPRSPFRTSNLSLTRQIKAEPVDGVEEPLDGAATYRVDIGATASPSGGSATYRLPAKAEVAGPSPDQIMVVQDQVAESLALNMFGSLETDLNDSLDISLNDARESLGGVEIALVAGLDDSDSVPAHVASSDLLGRQRLDPSPGHPH